MGCAVHAQLRSELVHDCPVLTSAPWTVDRAVAPGKAVSIAQDSWKLWRTIVGREYVALRLGLQERWTSFEVESEPAVPDAPQEQF